MTGKIRILLLMLAFLGLLIHSPSVALADQIQLTLTSVGSTTFPSDAHAGVYVDPYVGTLAADGGQQPDVAVICDDFADDTYVGEVWTAVASMYDPANAHSLDGTRMSQLSGVTGGALVTDYSEVAYLSEELLAHTGDSSDALLQRIYISFAIWSIFDANGLANDSQKRTGVNPWLLAQDDPANYAADASAIQGYLTDAANHIAAGTADLANVIIYSPQAWVSGPTDGLPQEFLVVTSNGTPISWGLPEGSALPYLPFDLLALFGGIFLLRKRILAD